MLRRELVRDLFRAPMRVEVLLHDDSEYGVGLKPSRLRSRAASSHQRVRGERVMDAITGTVAREFTSDRRHRPPQLYRDPARRPASPAIVRDDHPLGFTQIPVGLCIALVPTDDRLDDPRAGWRDDRAVLPPVPSLAIDPEASARLRDQDPLLQQLRERSLLVVGAASAAGVYRSPETRPQATAVSVSTSSRRRPGHEPSRLRAEQLAT